MGDLLIREASPLDRAAVALSLRRLGQQSRYQRFLGNSSEPDLDRMLRIDHWHHELLLAFSPAPRAPIGVTEYIRLEEFDLAELAISVVDGWQRQGVGRLLLEELRRRALAAGIRRFAATLLRGNRGALALARELGRSVPVAASGSVLELMIELDAHPRALA